ncbi:MAG: AbrB/MazE/SpoVT family DNA-binding domain-containing protein [Candidatus Omnitrophica bacterium]|nr:AbrB/MazE/SpoVT family DNA-binding domain-containing protein [Candidatus Omnitrophota bacterium]MBU1127935.1 AbrB/MazE/SpoVT family DNA-binding domain-containing protein [Candidatus Omnitrophota bacterium]MBU1784492.1 AbrB/MazE/SpoVT family DNA-binding domain-containing protein [Candidatus Omnitrophota bacterium]MBU1851618.1 AbrB/MazE/SpoVT family DNA-binding domain-containing protein [Candidatus Omnitrophota bacterium]
MKVHVIPIGNSKGIRIPKVLLKLCHIRGEVDLEVKGAKIVITPVERETREEWTKAFKKMRENNEDRLLIDDDMDLEMENWGW